MAPHNTNNQESICAHWFTYAGDGDLTLVSIDAFRRTFPEARIVVIDDALHPTHPGVRLACEMMRAEWRESTFHRGGNLRGTECIVGILNELYTSATTDPYADIVIKIDPDTLVINRDWMDDFMASTAGMTAADDRGSAYGCCYALRHEALLGLSNSVRITPPNEQDVDDVFISCKFNDLFPRSFQRIPMWKPTVDNFGNGPHGSFVPYNWSTPLSQDKIQSYAQRFAIINCANRVPQDVGKTQIADLMHRIFKAVARPLQGRDFSGKRA